MTSRLLGLAALCILLALGLVLTFILLPKLLRRPQGNKSGLNKSNLADEFTYSDEGQGEWSVKSLWIFPLKSCRGVELQEAQVVATGLEHDRQFMLAEEIPSKETEKPGWKSITLRQYPKMALIETEIYEDKASATGGTLVVTFPIGCIFPFLRGKRSFKVPLAANEEIMSKFPHTPVGIWSDKPLSYDISSMIPSELQELETFLGTKNRLALFRVSNSQGLRKVCGSTMGEDILGRRCVTGFADACPIQMLNLHSVRELNSRVASKIPYLSSVRFRPNIVVSGPNCFDEDSWKVISFSGNIYHAVCKTIRCRLPNVDPETGEKHMQEPDRTMRSYRNIDEEHKNSACFGMSLVPADEGTTLRVGDKLVVHERDEKYRLKQKSAGLPTPHPVTNKQNLPSNHSLNGIRDSFSVAQWIQIISTLAFSTATTTDEASIPYSKLLFSSTLKARRAKPNLP